MQRRFYMFTLLALMALLLAACPATPEAGTGTGVDVTAETPAADVTEPAAEATEPAAEEETETPEADATETPMAEESTEITDTVDITDTGEITGTGDITGTPEVDATDEVTATEDMTDTAGTGTDTGAMATLNISESDEVGSYLSDAEGRTLYTFTGADDSAIDTSMWEVVEAGDADTVGEGLDESLLGSVDQDGTQQLTYNDNPLYRYTGDAQPGDMLGQGLDESWYALSDQGEPIQE